MSLNNLNLKIEGDENLEDYNFDGDI